MNSHNILVALMSLLGRMPTCTGGNGFSFLLMARPSNVGVQPSVHWDHSPSTISLIELALIHVVAVLETFELEYVACSNVDKRPCFLTALNPFAE